MQPTLSMWFQGLSPERRRRLEVALASASEARLNTHAEQALNLVAVLAHRTTFDQAIDRYVQMMDLGPEEAQIVETRALVALGEMGIIDQLSREPRNPLRLNWRYATPLGAVRFVRRQLRRSAEEDLWIQLSEARAEEALIRTHIKHALGVIRILKDELSPDRATALYLEQLAVPSARGRAVYQRTLARVASVELPRLEREAPGGENREPPE